MDKNLVEYCGYIKNFKTTNNIIIIDKNFKIAYLNNQDFFNRYSSNFQINADIFECLKHLPCFETKKQIYDNLVKNQHVAGYFVCQNISNSDNYLIDNVKLSPIMLHNNELIGIELEVVELTGLPLINLTAQVATDLTRIKLTEREQEIITLKTMGKTNLEISQILGSIYQKEISQHTIANIIKQQIYPKLGVQNKLGMIKAAHNFGLGNLIPKSLLKINQLILFPIVHE